MALNDRVVLRSDPESAILLAVQSLWAMLLT